MGTSSSKEEEIEEDVFDPQSIFYDDLGNLCYGPNESSKRNIQNEIKTILKIESEEEEKLQAEIEIKRLQEEERKENSLKLLSEDEAKKSPDETLSTIAENDDENDPTKHELIEEVNDLWYVMDSSWVENWLSHVHLDVNQPGPGPCDNRRLIEWNNDERKWTGRDGLLMAIKSKTGDYRRVSENVWNAYKKFYPDNGPAISFLMKRSEKCETGKYDVSNWTVHDHPVPADHEIKKKKKFFRGFKKYNDDDDEENNENDNKENILKDTNTVLLDEPENSKYLKNDSDNNDFEKKIDDKDIINSTTLTLNTNINIHKEPIVNTVKSSIPFEQASNIRVDDVDSDDDYVVTTPIVSPKMYSIDSAEIDSDDDM
jgi:hypothetical protein